MQGRLQIAKFGSATPYFKSLAPISEDPEETRAAEGAAADDCEHARPPSAAKENRWKLAFRQLVFMKRMNMQFNDRAKSEIELRQQNIAVRERTRERALREDTDRMADLSYDAATVAHVQHPVL